MSHDNTQHFRFLDLPREIRNQVYGHLLCSFKPAPTKFTRLDLHEVDHVEHGTDTAILRTSTQIHREAYNVMIKTNRFLCVKSVGIPIRILLNSQKIMVLSEDDTTVSGFKGYSLAVSIFREQDRASNPDGPAVGRLEPYSFMLLGRDLEKLCLALADGELHMAGFTSGLSMSITIAPMLSSTLPRYKESPTEYFSGEKTQRILLLPFQEHLRGIKRVQIRGKVTDPIIGKTVSEVIARDEWSDTHNAVNEMKAAKEQGNRFFRDRNIPEACDSWQVAAEKVEKLHRGSSWKALIESGGRPFATEIAEIYFSTKLNVAHCFLGGFGKGMGGYTHDLCVGMAGCALKDARNAFRMGFWMEGFKWDPANAQMAKYLYRSAYTMRIDGDPPYIRIAELLIKRALAIAPGDAKIEKERQDILAWKRASGQ